ncbi:Ankyrin repeat and socs box protein 2 [Penicillium longicatenatum]|uniref:Ankyrin repeat and socs box protein 2 n=1 Tax=Penicillium longicatenatum TaxID=1561947 RepID=UPI002546BB3A|nr:Ankyrin repeat and socs box protein 2 [Penicillium longicatenatum]KAJ5631131.1 Ankyrin repeat and socs box protein 2 [Penicillium longicatenatum]
MVTGKWKASLEHEMFSLPIDCWGWLAQKRATRLHVLHLVINKDTTDGKVLMAAINNGVEYAIMAKGEGAAEDVLASTRAQYSRAIIAIVFPGLHVSYPDFLADSFRDFWGRKSRLSFSDDESHALAVLAAAHEGDVPTLDALLSQRRLNPYPVIAYAVLGPLALAIRSGNINAVKFLLARLDSHGDVDRPDVPNFEGDFAIHRAVRVGNSEGPPEYMGMTPLDVAASAGQLAVVKYLLSRPDTHRTGGEIRTGYSTMYYAVESQELEVIEFILAQPETVITAAKPMKSPLYQATRLDRLDIVKLLDEKGKATKGILLAKPQGVDRELPSVLITALMDGQDEMFMRLVGRDEFSPADRRKAAISAVGMRKLDKLQVLLDVGNLDLGSAPGFRRDVVNATRGRLNMIEVLKRKGVVDDNDELSE